MYYFPLRKLSLHTTIHSYHRLVSLTVVKLILTGPTGDLHCSQRVNTSVIPHFLPTVEIHHRYSELRNFYSKGTTFNFILSTAVCWIEYGAIRSTETLVTTYHTPRRLNPCLPRRQKHSSQKVDSDSCL